MEFLPDEQQQLLRNYILLPLVIRVFQRDQRVIWESPIKTKGPYIKMMEAVIGRVDDDLRQTRKELRKAGVKIYDERKTEDGVKLKYSFKGYHHEKEYLWRLLKFEVETVMERYLG